MGGKKGGLGGVVSGLTDAIGLTDSGAPDAFMKQAGAQNAAIMRRLDKIDLPDEEKMRIALEMPELVGLLEAEEISPSEFESIVEDQRLRGDQMQALDALRQRAEEGMTAEDKFRMEEMLGDVAAQEKSQRAAIEQEMARRGMESSGAALAAKLAGTQNAANQGRQQAMQMAAQASQDRMDASQRLAQQAGNVRQQDFNIAGQRASAMDAINRANAMNRQDVASRNLGLRQQIADRRTDLANQQQMYNRGLEQQQFQNKMAKAGAQNQVNANMANQAMQQAQSSAAANQAVMSGLFNMGAAAIGKSDRDAKEDIKDGSPSIREFLDKLDPYEYNYKEEHKEDLGDEGPQLGVMAQDLEESDLGEQFVEPDEEGTKRVDYGKMASTQLAALADLHKRLKKVEGDK